MNISGYIKIYYQIAIVFPCLKIMRFVRNVLYFFFFLHFNGLLHLWKELFNCTIAPCVEVTWPNQTWVGPVSRTSPQAGPLWRRAAGRWGSVPCERWCWWVTEKLRWASVTSAQPKTALCCSVWWRTAAAGTAARWRAAPGRAPPHGYAGNSSSRWRARSVHIRKALHFIYTHQDP